MVPDSVAFTKIKTTMLVGKIPSSRYKNKKRLQGSAEENSKEKTNLLSKKIPSKRPLFKRIKRQ